MALPVGKKCENIDSNEADEKTENDRPQNEPNVPPAWADLLKEKESMALNPQWGLVSWRFLLKDLDGLFVELRKGLVRFGAFHSYMYIVVFAFG